MQHPFDGIITNEQGSHAVPTRREAMGTMLAAALGASTIVSQAAAQVVTTDALNEEGGLVTTQALGEEAGATTRALNEEGGVQVTTEPFGEEAGRVLSQRVQGLEDGAAQAPFTTRALNEEGAVVTTLAVGEEGDPSITKALNETGGRGGGVLVQPGSFELSKEQLETAWKDLRSTDAGKALQACALIYGHKKPVDFLKNNLKVDVKPDEDQVIAQLIKDLDDNSPRVRSKAQADLQAKGVAALGALLRTAKNPPSTEVSRRVTELLSKMREDPTYLQMQRGIQVLVALKTEDARQLLETLSKATPETVVTHLAKEALTAPVQPMPVPTPNLRPGIQIRIQRGPVEIQPAIPLPEKQ